MTYCAILHATYWQLQHGWIETVIMLVVLLQYMCERGFPSHWSLYLAKQFHLYSSSVPFCIGYRVTIYHPYFPKILCVRLIWHLSNRACSSYSINVSHTDVSIVGVLGIINLWGSWLMCRLCVTLHILSGMVTGSWAWIGAGHVYIFSVWGIACLWFPLTLQRRTRVS